MNSEIETDLTPTLTLGSMQPGEVFHFARTTFTEAVYIDSIYMVVSGGKNSRQRIVNIKDGTLLRRDNSHRVHKLQPLVYKGRV
jgi:hypothetical protein